MERRLLLDVVVAQRTAILQLLAGKDQALLVRRNALLVLDLGLDVLDRVRRLNLERDRLAGKRLHEYLHGINRFGSRWQLWRWRDIYTGDALTPHFSAEPC